MKKKLLFLFLLVVIPLTAMAGVWYYGAGEATNLENRIGFAKHDQKIVTGESADPRSGGYAAGEGSLLLRTSGELYAKTSSGDTDWQELLSLAPTSSYDATLDSLTIGADDHQEDINGMTMTGRLIGWVDDGNTTYAEVGLGRAEDTTATIGATIFGARSRGSLASKTVVQSGDNLLDVVALGHDGTDYVISSRIDMEVDGTPGGNDMPGRIVFRTTPDGGVSATEAMRVNSDNTVNVVGAISQASIPIKTNVSTFYTADADVIPFSDWSTAGLANATWGADTTNELSGTTSYLLTNVTGSANEFIESVDITVPKRSKQKEIAVKFNATYDGDDDDIRCYLYDVTNSAELGAAVNIKSSTASREYAAVGYALSTTATVSVRCEIETVNNGKLLVMDDFVVTDDPFVYKDLIEYQVITLGDANGFGSSSTQIRRFTTTIKSEGSGIISDSGDSATLGREFTILKKCMVHMSYSDARSISTNRIGFSVNSNELTTAINFITKTHRLAISEDQGGDSSNVAWSGVLEPGDVIRPHSNDSSDATAEAHFSILAIATNEHVVVPRTAPKWVDISSLISGWTTTTFAEAMYYIDSSGGHAMQFNITGVSPSTNNESITISDTTFISTDQAIAVDGTNNDGCRGKASSGTGTLAFGANTATTNWRLSGNVRLASKPDWADPVTSQYLAAIPPKLSLKYSTDSDQAITLNTWTNVIYDELNSTYGDHDNHVGSYNTSTGVYTAPKDGNYLIIGSARFQSYAWTAGNGPNSRIVKNGTSVAQTNTTAWTSLTDTMPTVNISAVVNLSKGDTVSYQVLKPAASGNLSTSNDQNWISITEQ